MPTDAAQPEQPRLPYTRILVTGGAGYLGGLTRAILRNRVPHVRVADIKPIADVPPGEESLQFDLRDPVAVARACEGVDAIVHLGASLNVDDWQQTLDVNIAGTYNVYEGARQAGVRRVVYASSHHAVGMYPIEQKIGLDVRLRPDSLYGVSKCFGEAVAQYFFDKFGIESVSLRIGSTRPVPALAEPREFITWLSEPDYERLVVAALAARDIGCMPVYGVSLNGECWWDNSQAKELGFEPLDRSVPPPAHELRGPSYPLQGGKRAMYGLLQGEQRLCRKT